MSSRAAIQVPVREFDLTEPWNIPEGCPPLVLVRAIDGTPPRLATLLHLYRDSTTLYLLYSGVDASIQATKYDHDDSLWEEDVLEAFLAPEKKERYFELEISPLGTLFDARIDSPDLDRSTMTTDLAWHSGAAGILRRVRREPKGFWRFETLLTVPFASLTSTPPLEGEEWFANFYRIDRDPELGDEYSAWQPTLRTPVDFHVPEAFGLIRF